MDVNNRILFLSEMFPLIPTYLFNPIITLTEPELNEIIEKLTGQENDDEKIKYLQSFSLGNECDRTDEGLSESEEKSRREDEDIISSSDDKLLAKFEEETEKCLILGRSFLKAAHKLFASKFDLEFLNIDSIPPEITEMNWQVTETLMESIYRSFFEDLGLIGSISTAGNDDKREIKFPKKNMIEKLTIREIIDEERAMENSIANQKKEIDNNDGLKMQITTLQMKYPEISRDELSRLFIASGMDTQRTISELSNSGHSSNNWFVNSKLNINTREAKRNRSDCAIDAIRIQKLEARIKLEKHRLKDFRSRINLKQNSGLHSHIETYWREEAKQCSQRLRWFEEQLALASAAQQSVLYGNRYLDLHGFTCASALVALEQRIDEFHIVSIDPTKGKHLTIICGRGLHSLYGRPRLKPAVRRYLQHHFIKYSEPFEGTFRVPLKQFRR